MKDRLNTLREKLDGHEIDGILLTAVLPARFQFSPGHAAGTR